jgi:hypothetical protein
MNKTYVPLNYRRFEEHVVTVKSYEANIWIENDIIKCCSQVCFYTCPNINKCKKTVINIETRIK